MKHIVLGMAVVIGFSQATLAKADPPTSKELFAALNLHVEIKNLQQPMNLKDALGLMYEHCHTEKKNFAFIVDNAAFQRENPDCQKVLDTEIHLVDLPPQMKLRVDDLLRRMLSKCPIPTTYLVRDRFIEITTKSSASIESLLQRNVSGVIQNVTLDEALERLAGMTGASIILDPRVKEQSAKRITATFRNGATLESALFIVTDMADLQFVVMSSAIYVTGEERAKALRKRIEERQIHGLGLPGLGLPGLGLPGL